MTAAPAGPGRMAVRAIAGQLRTETASRPLAARGANHNQAAPGVPIAIQGAQRAGLAARQMATAATGQAG
jgi:hypothetical protein